MMFISKESTHIVAHSYIKSDLLWPGGLKIFSVKKFLKPQATVLLCRTIKVEEIKKELEQNLFQDNDDGDTEEFLDRIGEEGTSITYEVQDTTNLPVINDEDKSASGDEEKEDDNNQTDSEGSSESNFFAEDIPVNVAPPTKKFKSNNSDQIDIIQGMHSF